MSARAGRPVSRAVVGAAILLLGIVAASRMPVSYAPEITFPELSVAFHLPLALDVEEVTRRWVVPIESAARSLGVVRAMTGEVGSDGGRLQILFEPGTDPVLKTARLLSELSRLRRELPEGGWLEVWPAARAEGEEAMLLILIGPAASLEAEEVAEEIRDLPGVRDVEISGAPSTGTRVEMRSGPAATADLVVEAGDAVRRSLARPRLGLWDRPGRSVPVLSGRPTLERLEDLVVRSGRRAVPLSGVAGIERGALPLRRLFRMDGEPAIGLVVTGESGASPLDLDSRLREYASSFSGLGPAASTLTVLESAGTPLRRLLSRAAAGAAAATLLAALAGWLMGGLPGLASLAFAVPVAFAAGLNVMWLAGESINSVTAPALMLAVASTMPFAFLRCSSGQSLARGAAVLWIVSTSMVPVAVALARGSLEAVLAEPSRTFALTGAAAALSTLLVPARAHFARRSGRIRRAYRALMREPATILLVGGTICAALFTLYGAWLDPRTGAAPPETTDLAIQVSLPEGTTLERAREAVAEIERELARTEAVEKYWSVVRPSGAFLSARILPEERSPGKVEWVRTALGYALRGGAASVTVERRAARGASSSAFLGEAYEESAATDEHAYYYSFVLRSADLRTLRRGYEAIWSRLGRAGVSYESVQTGWGAPSVRVDLDPLPGTAPGRLRFIAQALGARTTPPPARRTHGARGEDLIFSPPLAPKSETAIPQRAELMERLTNWGPEGLVPGEAVRVSESAVFPEVQRQSGRFVLPVRVDFPWISEDIRKTTRERLHTTLETAPLPRGCDLERPSLARYRFDPGKLRAYALAALVPGLLFAVSALWLDSLGCALAALLPACLGLASITPLLHMDRLPLDDATIFSLAAIFFGTLPAALVFLQSSMQRGSRTSPARAVHGTAQEYLPAAVWGALALIMMLGVPALGAETDSDAWPRPLRIAAVGGAVATGCTGVVLPASMLIALIVARRDRQESKARARPPKWADPGEAPSLAARNLTKTYAGGFTALKRVEFNLGPGIVGLLGPNGAGKTTLLRLLTGLLSPTRGQVLFKGVPVVPENLAAFRHHIGYLPQEFNAYPGFTAEQFLDYWALERGITRRVDREREMAELLSSVGLEADASRKVRDFSGGMRQRIGIARALLGAPPVLIVDEPTTGLDVEARNRFRETLLRIAGERIVILSTHIAGDIQAAATRVLLLYRGRLLLDASPSDLIRLARGRVFEAEIADDELREFGRRYRLTARVRILAGLRVRGVTDPGEKPPGREVEPSLEEAYLAQMALADLMRPAQDGASFSFL